jgi:hypothetical protein
MEELVIGDQTFISSKRASEITGYAKDYIGQLAREGRVTATLVGRGWYVLESSIREHRFGKAEIRPQIEAPAPQKAPLSSLGGTWTAPRYTVEKTPTILHTVGPIVSPGVDVFSTENTSESLETEENTEEKELPVLTDMQSAWQDWFKTREIAEDSKEEAVLISRIPEEAPQDSPEPQEEVSPVTLHVRREELAQSVESLPEAVEEISVSEEEMKPTILYEGPVRRGRYIPQAVMLVIAGLAVLIAVIGTGGADFIAKSGGLQAGVLHFLDGSYKYERSSI